MPHSYNPASDLQRRRYALVFVYALLLLPWLVYGAIQAMQTNANSPLDWVDDRFAAREAYDEFTARFGAGDTVMISWPGCVLDESRIDQLAHSLRRAPGFQDSEGWLFGQVITGREWVAHLTAPPLSLDLGEAKHRLGGAYVGPDGETTCVLIQFTERGLSQRSRLVPLIQKAVTHYCGVAPEEQHLAGPVIDGYEVDRASQRTMERFAPLSSLIVFAVCVVCLGSFYAGLLVFGIASLCQAIALSVVHYSGGEMTALLIVLPPLIQVLAIAGGIHLTNYYFDALPVGETSPQGYASAVETALHVGWLPCVLSSTTTAIGLGSLAVSGLAAVREFGGYSALGVLLTTAALLVLLPGVLHWKPIRAASKPTQVSPGRFWQGMLAFEQRASLWITATGLIAMIALGWGVWRLEASVRIETLFENDSRLVRDYRWLEEHVGALVPIEVVVLIDRDTATGSHSVPPQATVELLRAVGEQLRNDHTTLSVTSCLEFMPNTDELLQSPLNDATFRNIKASLIEQNYLSEQDGVERWRFTSHISAFGHSHYGDVLTSMRERLQPVLNDHAIAENVSLEFSGLMPLVHEIQEQLLRDLYYSFLTAFLLIAVVMTVVQAGILPGLLSMLPNLFPSLVLFGVLGWMGHPIDIGSIMTASVAMGIAVDDTLHYLTFYGRKIQSGATREESVLAAYQHCGRAMIQTTLICGTGLAMFALSDFVPTARFAWMMVALLFAALVGDLVLLPAVLLSPLGRLFPTAKAVDRD